MTRHIKKPNFLLMGAGKSGVGMISRFLHQHPQIYTSNDTEPFYFTKEIVENYSKEDNMYEAIMQQSKLNWDDYLEVFSKATTNEVFLGDTTKQYLYHYDTVIPQVKEALGDIPIIIILRDPIPRAFEMHVYQNTGQVVSFEKALELEDERKRIGYNSIWFYKDSGNYCESVKAYKASFSKVYIGLFEDYEKDPLTFVQSLYQFLGADETFVPDIQDTILPYSVPKNKAIQITFYFIKKLKLDKMILILPEKLKKMIKKILYVDNDEVDHNKVKLNKNTENMLKTYYKNDINCLEKVMERKLTNWLIKH